MRIPVNPGDNITRSAAPLQKKILLSFLSAALGIGVVLVFVFAILLENTLSGVHFPRGVLILLLMFVAFPILAIGVLFLILRASFRPLNQFLLWARHATDLEPISVPAACSKEIRELCDILNGTLARLREAQEYRMSAEKELAYNLLCRRVAHDLRSPLSSMQVAVRGLERIASVEPQAGQFLTLLQMSATRLGKIADDLLKKHQGEEEQPTIFSVHAVVDEIVGEYQHRDDIGLVRFLKRYHSHAIELYGPRTKLQRAVGNVVKNGIEAMKSEGTVTITTNSTDGHAVIVLQDTGPGMTPETLAKVLQGGHTEGKTDGHGIGTRVVREAVELFGGRVEGESIVGVGTTFRLVLPLPTGEQRESAERESLALRELRVPVAAGEPVLVVDDEPSMREQWRVLLAAQGTKVRLCTCYEDVEAQNITAHISHTAIVDYHFANSVHNGIEVIQLLQKRTVEHLILCTAEYWKPSVQKQAKELGIQLCPKPVPEKIVVELITSRADVPEVSTSIVASPDAPTLQRVEHSESPATGYRVLLIDDDEAIRMCWKMERGRLEIGDLKAFGSFEECEAAGLDYREVDIAFVDKNIAGCRPRRGFCQVAHRGSPLGVGDCGSA